MKTITLTDNLSQLLNVSRIEIENSGALSKPMICLIRRDGFGDSVILDEQIAPLVDGDVSLLVNAIEDKISRIQAEMESSKPNYYPGI